MTLIWPSELPKPTRAGHQAQWQDTRLRKAAGGPPGYRRRFSSAARLVALTIELTRVQKAVFDGFFEDTSNGALPFLMPDPTTDGWPALTDQGAPLQTATGAPILLSAQWLCLFGEELPTETFVRAKFNIAFSVAVLP